MPKISIIIPAYNAGSYIEETLGTIMSQTFEDFECIIIDDGSKDNTLDLLRRYEQRDCRFKVIAIANSGCPAVPRNIGLAAARGEYIAMFDSDDLMRNDKLEISIRTLDNNMGADILFSNFSVIDERGETIKTSFLEDYETLWNLFDRSLAKGECCYLNADRIYAGVAKVNFIGTSSVVLRRAALDKNDKFNEGLKNSDDRLFWLNYTMKHNAVFVNEILHKYRARADGISGRGFIYRGKSKIKGLEIALANCPRPEIKRLIEAQIGDNCCSMAYAYKDNKAYRLQIKFAARALKLHPGIKPIKLLVHGLISICIKGWL